MTTYSLLPGACGILANTSYQVWFVAEDYITPTPNLQPSPTLAMLNTSDPSNGGFTCNAPTFTQQLRPNIALSSSSPGFPTGQYYAGNGSAATK